MNEISFKVQPSPETNDYEVCIYIDGSCLFDLIELDPIDEDSRLFDRDLIGLDPKDFLRQFEDKDQTELVVGRCPCGSLGCYDTTVQIDRIDDKIIWKINKIANLVFSSAQYENAVIELGKDTSWEDLNRRIGRLVSKIFIDTRVKRGFLFDWASAPMKDNFIYLSYSKGHHQKILKFKWDGETEESALASAQEYRSHRFRNQ